MAAAPRLQSEIRVYPYIRPFWFLLHLIRRVEHHLPQQVDSRHPPPARDRPDASLLQHRSPGGTEHHLSPSN